MHKEKEFSPCKNQEKKKGQFVKFIFSLFNGDDQIIDNGENFQGQEKNGQVFFVGTSVY